MSSDIGFALFMSSVGLILLSAVVTIIVPRTGPRLKKYQEQRAALNDFFANAEGSRLEFDWFRFGEVPKQELVMLAGEHHWRFDSDEITDTAWILRFRK